MEELELKFCLSNEQAAALRAELKRRGARQMRLAASYFDTADGRLTRHGVSLRLRREGRRWVQTLKAEGASLVQRLEHDVPLRVAAGAAPLLDVSRHDGTPAGAELRQALTDGEVNAVLVERYRADVTRLACMLALDETMVEAALDQGAIAAGERSVPVCEVELEHKAGPVAPLFVLAKAWCAHGGWSLDTRSKAQRGSLLAEGREHAAPLRAADPRYGHEPGGAALLRAVLRSALDQVLGNASEVAAGSLDEEHVHQLRVGLRRLRTALRELAALASAGSLDAAWEAPLALAFARLGELRDDETVAKAVRPLLEHAGAPLCEWHVPERRADPATIVREPAFQAVLLDLLAFAHGTQAEAGAIDHRQALDQLAARMAKLHRQVVAAGKAFETLPVAEQHRARKRLKRLRYLAEFARPLAAGKAVQRYLRRLGPAQDALGAHNDVAVAADKFRADAQRDPAAWFAAGYLLAYLKQTARAAHDALAPIADAPRFWKGWRGKATAAGKPKEEAA